MGDGGGEVPPTIASACIARSATLPVPADWTWATQPAPFRQYRGCRQVELLHRPLEESPPHDGCFPAGGRALRLDRRSLSQMPYDGLALSA